MPGAARRMYPARTSSLWLGTSASAGSSRRVRRNSLDIRNSTALPPQLPGVKPISEPSRWREHGCPRRSVRATMPSVTISPDDGPTKRGDFAVLRRITTRWADNDVYGHVNNVVYYSYFDTAVN